MPFKKDGTYVLDDTEDVPPDARTPAQRARIRELNNPSAEQERIDAYWYERMWGEPPGKE